MDYNHGACFDNWFVGKFVIGLLALKYFHTVFVQTDSSSGSTEVHFLDPSFLSGGRVNYISGATGHHHKPLPGSVCLVYDIASHWTCMNLSKRITFLQKCLSIWEFLRLEIWLCSDTAMSLLMGWGNKKSCRSIQPRSGNHSLSNVIVRGDVIALLCYIQTKPFSRW